MQYYQYVTFPFQEKLRHWSRQQPWPRDSDLWVAMSYGATVTDPLPPNLLEEIRLWLFHRGLLLHNCYCFIRSAHTVKLKDIHVDQHGLSPDPCCASLVVVTEGSGPMIWYQGQYQLEKHRHSIGSAYYDIKGVETLREAHRANLAEPALCHTSLPHTAVCDPNSEPRVSVTFRFRGNPQFDTILQKLKD